MWNSLEIAKLIVGVLTPITVVVIGFWISSQLKRLDHSQWVNQKLIERRLKVFDEMAPDLNDLFCYFSYIGSWKERAPDEVVEIKRRLDRVVHVNSPLFSYEYLSVYQSFISTCYETYTGWGNDAKLRTKYSKRRDAFGNEWRDSWENYFSSKDIPDKCEIKHNYTKLMQFFSKELGISLAQENG